MARDDFGRTDYGRAQGDYGGYESWGATGPSAYGYGYGLGGPTSGGYGAPGPFSGEQAGFGTVGHRSAEEGAGRRDRPNYAGRGPKSYRRSDDRICEDVCEALTRHPAIDASAIDVRVENSEVVLTGTVDDRRIKRLAEDVAEGVSGVTDVRNEVKIQRGARERHAGVTRTPDREVDRLSEEENASPQAGTETRRGTRRSTTEAGMQS
jgi:hypothetical protein